MSGTKISSFGTPTVQLKYYPLVLDLSKHDLNFHRYFVFYFIWNRDLNKFDYHVFCFSQLEKEPHACAW